MSDVKISEEQIKEAWFSYLTEGEMPAYMQAPWFERKVFRPLIKSLPRSPRCDICYIPFRGIGGNLSRIFWKAEPSKLNPHICNLCENFAQKYHGGVEIEISMMFVDVRDSVTLAENTPLNDYRKLINRFYRAVTEEFYRSYGFVEKLIGDEVAGFFVPGFAGKDHARVAIETGKRIMKKMGYGSPSGSWLPIGIGVNTGVAYVGSVTPDGGGADVAMLGDSVNTTARLTSQAGAGEIIISDSALQAAKLSTDGMELRNLKLKGKSEEVPAWVLKVTQ